MAGNFIIEAWTELGLALLSIFLRLYFRYTQVGLIGMTWDDYLAILAGVSAVNIYGPHSPYLGFPKLIRYLKVFYALETAAAHFIAAFCADMGTNNFTPEQRAKLVRGSKIWNYAVNGSKAHIFGWFVYTALIWTLKSCWTIYYSRMTNGLEKMDMRIKVAWFLNGTTYIAAICMIIFKCWPLHRQWQIYPDPGNNCYPGASKLNVTFITVLNVSTDLYLMAIPLPIIYRAHLDIKKKIYLMILFSGGWIVITFSILRCVTLVTVGPTEPSESGDWSVRESFLAVFVSNAPMVFPLLKRWSCAAMAIVSSTRKESKVSFPLENLSKSRGIKRTIEHSHGRSGKKHRVLHPLSIPDDTTRSSDDAIVMVDNGTDDFVQDNKNGTEALGVVSEESEGSFASERRSQTGVKCCNSLSPGEVLMVRGVDDYRGPVGSRT